MGRLCKLARRKAALVCGSIGRHYHTGDRMGLRCRVAAGRSLIESIGLFVGRFEEEGRNYL